ncbi:MAG: phytoene desaturase family protein [Actinomycetota bacterium]
MADYDVIVIGAGCGGITAGALLAKQGRKVLVLEQSDRVGGCCSTFEREGYRFDVGASIVEVIHPIRKAFEELGTSFEKEVELVLCDPIYSYIFEDGSRINYPLSLEGTAEVISRISPEDGKQWYRLADYFADMMRQTIETFFTNPCNGFLDMVKMGLSNPRMIKFLPLFFRSYQDVILRYFKNDVIQQTMSFQSFYCGLPPELAPGFIALIPYSEHEGIWYPKGGMIQIPQAFRRLGERLGMEVRLNARVDRVLVRNRRAEGVRLADGTEITSDLVVSNVNAKKLYLEMIGEEHLPWLARYGIRSYEVSMSCVMLYVGVDYRPPLEAHHSLTIGPLQMMNDFWWNEYRQGKIPEQVHGLICWPTESDPSLAPEGHHVLNIMGMGPYRLQGTDWDREKQRVAERMINGLSERAIPGLADHVKVLEVSTPLDFERRLLSPGGAIYGLQMDLPAQAVFRPAARSKCIKGLYLTGASTHPGGGVPSTVASGLIASKLVEKYEG